VTAAAAPAIQTGPNAGQLPRRKLIHPTSAAPSLERHFLFNELRKRLKAHFTGVNEDLEYKAAMARNDTNSRYQSYYDDPQAALNHLDHDPNPPEMTVDEYENYFEKPGHLAALEESFLQLGDSTSDIIMSSSYSRGGNSMSLSASDFSSRVGYSGPSGSGSSSYSGGKSSLRNLYLGNRGWLGSASTGNSNS